jgi:hypothetical protein
VRTILSDSVSDLDQAKKFGAILTGKMQNENVCANFFSYKIALKCCVNQAIIREF